MAPGVCCWHSGPGVGRREVRPRRAADAASGERWQCWDCISHRGTRRPHPCRDQRSIQWSAQAASGASRAARAVAGAGKAPSRRPVVTTRGTGTAQGAAGGTPGVARLPYAGRRRHRPGPLSRLVAARMAFCARPCSRRNPSKPCPRPLTSSSSRNGSASTPSAGRCPCCAGTRP